MSDTKYADDRPAINTYGIDYWLLGEEEQVHPAGGLVACTIEATCVPTEKTSLYRMACRKDRVNPYYGIDATLARWNRICASTHWKYKRLED